MFARRILLGPVAPSSNLYRNRCKMGTAWLAEQLLANVWAGDEIWARRTIDQMAGQSLVMG